MLVSRTANETWVLRRFVSTRPALSNSKWKYFGASHERPDFVLVPENIGIELAEWLDEDQTAAAREIDRFEKELNAAAVEKNLSEFAKSLEPCGRERYMTLVGLKTLPKRQEKDLAINLLLEFLRDVAKPPTQWEQKYGVIYGAELPQGLSCYFQSAHLRLVRSGDINLGININRASSYDPEDALQALLDEVRDKLVTKRHLYSQAKADRHLTELWLVVHYGRGLLWNSPYHGIGLKEGRPLDEVTSRQIIVERCREFISEIGTGSFDRAFLFFDVSPGSQSFELWPG